MLFEDHRDSLKEEVHRKTLENVEDHQKAETGEVFAHLAQGLCGIRLFLI